MSPWPKGAIAYRKSIIVSWNKADIVRKGRDSLMGWDGLMVRLATMQRHENRCVQKCAIVTFRVKEVCE